MASPSARSSRSFRYWNIASTALRRTIGRSTVAFRRILAGLVAALFLFQPLAPVLADVTTDAAVAPTSDTSIADSTSASADSSAVSLAPPEASPDAAPSVDETPTPDSSL